MYIYVQVVLGNAFVSFSLAHALWATKFMLVYYLYKKKRSLCRLSLSLPGLAIY